MVKKSYFNKYIDTYINSYVRSFRGFNTDKYMVRIGGLANFITANDYDLSLLLHKLQTYGFEVTLSRGQDTMDEIQVECHREDNAKKELLEDKFGYKIENLITTIFVSSKTGISIVGILVMQIISRIISKSRIMYKAIVLDLDDTLWKGTLAEDGADAIIQNLCSDEAAPFISFMRFIQAMAKELGLYVAICSRNDTKDVLSVIEKLYENKFPLKGQIDCIIANYNDKSENIKIIARQLSILTNACVFIDDNKIVRDEVRENLPEVFVPDWESHDELLTLLMTCCVFDRFELSLKSRNRKRWYEVLQQEREKSYLPQLFVKANDDINHVEAVRLYAKSNQFKFTTQKEVFDGCKSVTFEIYRDNGENLGICSAITYTEDEQNIHVLNWAISCRYFEIGLEEYMLLYISTLAGWRNITFAFNDNGFNGKAVALIKKYKSHFTQDNGNGNICFIPDIQLISDMQLNTNLKEYSNG